MARRAYPTVPVRPAAELLEKMGRAVGQARSLQALDLGEQLLKRGLSSDQAGRLRHLLADWATALCRRGATGDATAVIRRALHWEAGPLGGDPTWLARLVELLARAGHPHEALALLPRLPDPPGPAAVLAHVADGAVRRGEAGRGLLPAEWHPGFGAVRTAFAHADAGRDDDARAALQGIGMRSPFLDWKLFLRGLLAYQQNDKDRALENWQRLDADRLPARLAAPLRLGIDPAFRAALSPDERAHWQRQADRILGDDLLAPLRAAQASLAGGNLANAFRQVEPVVAALRGRSPELVERLGRCFLTTVVSAGGPENMPTYLRVFGPPPDDPHLDRLKAMTAEQFGGPIEAQPHWRRFIDTIAAHPDRWPAPLGDRARALIWSRMGRAALDVELDPESEALSTDEEEFLRQTRRRPERRTGPPAPRRDGKRTAVECLERSIALAPDRLEPYELLVEHYLDRGDVAGAEAAGTRLLERFPEHLPTLEGLANLAEKRGDIGRLLDLSRRALRVNPLDRKLRERAVRAERAEGNARTAAGDWPAARVAYQAALKLMDERPEPATLCAWAVCEERAGDAERAKELRQRALVVPSAGPAVAFESMLAAYRLKKWPRNGLQAYQKAFAAAMAEPPMPEAVAPLARSLVGQHAFGQRYRGEKTHAKEVLGYLERAVPLPLTDAHREAVCAAMLELKALKPLRAHAGRGREQSPNNPYLCFYLAESYYHLSEYRRPVWKIGPLLDEARRLAEPLPHDERRRVLLDLIGQRQQTLGAFGFPAFAIDDFFKDFFDADEFEDEDED